MVFVVQGVVERAAMITYLQRQIPGLRVVLDDGAGPSRTFIRSIREAGGEAHVHMEEDVILPMRFAERVAEAVAIVGAEHVINFHRYGGNDAVTWKPGWATPRSFLNLQCVYVPAWAARLYPAWCDLYGTAYPSHRRLYEHPRRPHNDGHMDLSFRYFLRDVDRGYFIWSPALVQHRHSMSMITTRHRTRGTRYNLPMLEAEACARAWGIPYHGAHERLSPMPERPRPIVPNVTWVGAGG